VAIPTQEIPSGATFNFGDGNRTADDTGSGIGDLHIDAYIIAPQSTLNAKAIQAATVTLQSAP
jgi:hypothetical protein